MVKFVFFKCDKILLIKWCFVVFGLIKYKVCWIIFFFVIFVIK